MTSYAIIETGGKQLRVEPGRFYDVNRIAADEAATVTIDKVFFVHNDGEISVGQPLVDGARVEATVLRHLRGPKIIVYKMKPKKKTRRKKGHRQELTRLMINRITIGSTTIGEALVEQEAAESQPKPEVVIEPAADEVAGEAGAGEAGAGEE